MPMISYAQNREDVLLVRCFPEKGFYVDVGAADPIGHSVTKWFSEQGWTGVNVEPSRGFFQRIEVDRPNDVNLNVAVSDEPGELMFYEVEDLVGCSSLVPEVARELRKKGHRVLVHSVPVRTLAQIFTEFVPDERTVDFLKVDVEGYERAVLAGMDFRRWRPRVLVIEATRPSSPDLSHDHWEHLILPFDYHFAYFDGLNRYYVRAEDEALLVHFAKPVCPFDDYVLYEQVRLEQEAQAFQKMVEDRDRQLEEKETDLLRRSREYDALHFQWRAGREEIESLIELIKASREDLQRTQSELAATRDDLLQTQAELASARDEVRRTWSDLLNQRNALRAARAVLAETRQHVEAVRAAAFGPATTPHPHTPEALRCA